MNLLRLSCIVISLSILAADAVPQDRLSGPLGDLIQVQPGRSRRVSSAAPGPDSNRDNIGTVKPGETRVLADLTGPAVITHIWLTFNDARPNWISKTGSANPAEIVLRMIWDDGKHPAVETPLGDFFAAGFGLRSEIESTPVQVEDGDGYNCYWPMPFHKRAQITITNESEKSIRSFYYHIDYTEMESLHEETAYFCAQYRQEFPQTEGRDYLILDAEGRGHYVGTVMSVRSRSPEWFGEGDDKFYIDGETHPSIWGTGTEDYFLCAWGLRECLFPNFGCTYTNAGFGDLGVRYTLYRWHITDPVRFTKSLRFEIEHKGWISADETASGKIDGHVEREDDMATVAFWYQIGQPKRFTELPPLKDRVFPNLDLITEGKDLLATARHSEGRLEIQKGYGWTGEGQLLFLTSADKPFLEVDFQVKKKERRGLILRLTHSYDFGVYQIYFDGKKMGKPVDFYSEKIEIRDRYLGTFELTAGKHTFRFEYTGMNPLSDGKYIGLDSIRLRERWQKKRKSLR